MAALFSRLAAECASIEYSGEATAAAAPASAAPPATAIAVTVACRRSRHHGRSRCRRSCRLGRRLRHRLTGPFTGGVDKAEAGLVASLRRARLRLEEAPLACTAPRPALTLAEWYMSVCTV